MKLKILSQVHLGHGTHARKGALVEVEDTLGQTIINTGRAREAEPNDKDEPEAISEPQFETRDPKVAKK
jgi:hypothetical protein